MGKTSSSVKDRYNAKAYDNITLRVPKGQREVIQSFVQSRGESVNGFINAAISEKMERDAAQAPASITAHPYPERDIEGGPGRR